MPGTNKGTNNRLKKKNDDLNQWVSISQTSQTDNTAMGISSTGTILVSTCY
jgi:hypothetical protein